MAPLLITCRCQIYIIGGMTIEGQLLDDVWTLELDSWQWTQLQTFGAAPCARKGRAAQLGSLAGQLASVMWQQRTNNNATSSCTALTAHAPTGVIRQPPRRCLAVCDGRRPAPVPVWRARRQRAPERLPLPGGGAAAVELHGASRHATRAQGRPHGSRAGPLPAGVWRVWADSRAGVRVAGRRCSRSSDWQWCAAGAAAVGGGVAAGHCRRAWWCCWCCWQCGPYACGQAADRYICA